MSILLDPDWPQSPFIEVADKLNLTYQVRIPLDDTYELRRFVKNTSDNEHVQARLTCYTMERMK